MLRKILHIALIFSMLNATFGFTVSKHFCGEILQAVVINAEAPACCGEEKDAPNDCCSDTEEVVRLDDEQRKEESVIHVGIPVIPQLKTVEKHLFDYSFSLKAADRRYAFLPAFSPRYSPPFRLIHSVWRI